MRRGAGLGFMVLVGACLSPPGESEKDAAVPAVSSRDVAPATETVGFGRGFSIDLPVTRKESPRKNGWYGPGDPPSWTVNYFPVPEAELPIDTAAKAQALADTKLLSGVTVDPGKTQAADRDFTMETPEVDGAVDVVRILPLGDYVLALRCQATKGQGAAMRSACGSVR